MLLFYLNETRDTRGDAQNLLQSILTFNFLVLLPFWNELLRRTDCVQKRLQCPKMNFRDAYLDVKSLQMKILENRDALCQE